MFCLVQVTPSNVEIRMDKITKKFEWKIKDFLKMARRFTTGKSMESDNFTMAWNGVEDYFAFSLLLFPNGQTTHYKDYLSIFLVNRGKEDAFLDCDFCVELDDGTVQVSGFKNHVIERDKFWGHQGAFEKGEMIENKHLFLPNGELKIGCLVSINAPTKSEYFSKDVKINLRDFLCY